MFCPVFLRWVLPRLRWKESCWPHQLARARCLQFADPSLSCAGGVVITGLGANVRAVTQARSDRRWSARLTGADLGDRPFTPQQTLLSSSELLSVRLEPVGSDLQLIVKARMGERVPTPTIASNGHSLVVSFAGLAENALSAPWIFFAPVE